jgi:hypothetical protein
MALADKNSGDMLTNEVTKVTAFTNKLSKKLPGGD